MLDFFMAKIGPVPIWMIVAAGAVTVAIFAPKLLSRFGIGKSSSTSGANTNLGGNTTALPSEIDPVTGVPYSIESQTDPATGLPVYYSQAATGVPTGPTTTPTTTVDPNAAIKQQAIIAWQNHTGTTWTGPAGSYPAGWTQTPLPGAAQLLSPGHVRWIIPLPAVSTGYGVAGPGRATLMRWPYARLTR